MLLITFVSPIVIWILGAFALRVFWEWFLNPTYHLPVPSLPVAMGLMLIPSLFTTRSYAAYVIDRLKQNSYDLEELTERTLRTDVLAVVLVLVTLLFGWLVHFLV